MSLASSYAMTRFNPKERFPMLFDDRVTHPAFHNKVTWQIDEFHKLREQYEAEFETLPIVPVAVQRDGDRLDLRADNFGLALTGIICDDGAFEDAGLNLIADAFARKGIRTDVDQIAAAIVAS